MDFLYQNKPLKQCRQELRKNAAPQEIILWKYLRRRNLGYTFQRQYSIGPYIVDFYCAEKRLVIELDGSQHLKNKEYDLERTHFLKTQDIRVVRFWNGEINKNIVEVLDIIKKEISPRLEDSAPLLL